MDKLYPSTPPLGSDIDAGNQMVLLIADILIINSHLIKCLERRGV